jgi:hypothetical protein
MTLEEEIISLLKEETSCFVLMLLRVSTDWASAISKGFFLPRKLF